MATITDLSGSNTTINDDTSVQIGADSNINRFEFGNLILADILPTIIWLINMLSDIEGTAVSEDDCYGSSVSSTDKTADNSCLFDDPVVLFDDPNITFDGFPISGIMDMSGS